MPRLVDPDLFYAIFAYAGFGSITTVKLGQALVGQNAEQVTQAAPEPMPSPALANRTARHRRSATGAAYDMARAELASSPLQLLREANLRYSLVRLRENAESIAFYRGQSQEEVEVSARLGGAVENKKAILGTQRNLEFFTTAYSYLVQILPVLVVSPLYFAGSIELGVITQSTGWALPLRSVARGIPARSTGGSQVPPPASQRVQPRPR